MNSLIQNQNTGVITLKEITDLINIRHDRAMQKVNELCKEDSFGAVSKIDIVYNEQGQKILTYLLNKKQLQDSKNFKVYEILKSHNFENDKEMERKLHSRVWKAVKKKFNVPRYNEVPSLKFNEANDYIRRLTFGELV